MSVGRADERNTVGDLWVSSRVSDPDTRAEGDTGVKMPVDGGADDEESTKVGTFVQRHQHDVGSTSSEGVRI